MRERFLNRCFSKQMRERFLNRCFSKIGIRHPAIFGAFSLAELLFSIGWPVFMG
jgi:hypothetical protein